MDLPEILILGYSEASMFLAQPEASEVSHIITIHGQREFPLEPVDGLQRLALDFDDVELPDSPDPVEAAQIRLRQRRKTELGLRQKPPTRSDIDAIIDFARSGIGPQHILLCSCHAGISRSPAASLICLASWTKPGDEKECHALIRQIRPAAAPHEGMVRLADDALGRCGRLIDALRTG